LSYDPFFTGTPSSKGDFLSFFKDRPRYKAEDSQVWYENEDTGVYFSFDFSGDDLPEEDDEGPPTTAAFNMNYFRPHFFALQAEPEVNAFVSHFGCGIYDPQMDGMNEGPYSPEGFIKSWNAGNLFGYQAILRQESQDNKPFTLPTEQLEAVWRWNNTNEEIYRSLGMDIFVPRIMLMAVGGETKTFCVWPEAIPTLVPKTDLVYIPRDELAPKKLFRGKKQDYCLVQQHELDDVLSDFEPGLPLPARNPSFETSTKEHKALVMLLNPHKGEIPALPHDQVLNAAPVNHAQAT